MFTVLFLVGCRTIEKNQASSQQENLNYDIQYHMYKTPDEFKDIIKIEFMLVDGGPHMANNILVTQDKKIYDIMSMIEESEPLTDESKINDKMSGMARENNKMIITKVDGSKNEMAFSYDTLYEVGYIDIDGEKIKPDYSFFRYVYELEEYTNSDTKIEQRIVELFDKYNWTVDYKINTSTWKLPENLKHKAGEYPIKIYWAYNNELSKKIQFDFTGYLGRDVVVEIYRLREQLPEFMKPRRDARGIVLKYDNKIIGAYIDAGRHYSFACSLDRKGLKEITGKQWDRWVIDYIDYNDDLEIELSNMGPEDIIKEYFNALDKNDTKKMLACLTRKNLVQYLSTNLNNHNLFNDDKIDNNIKSAKLLDIEEFTGMDNGSDILEYKVEVDFDFKKSITSEDGIASRFVIMKKESEKSGWRIDGIGTGP